MNFWIRTYNIRIEGLPLSLLTWSTFVVFLCVLILSGILLLLPIQDKIKGKVTIYTSGQPLSLNAPSAGFIYFHKNEHEYIKQGDLLASIDVVIDNDALIQLEDLIYKDFVRQDFEFSQDMIDKINHLTTEDFRQINNELYNLSDLIKQLDILKNASDPVSLIKTLDKSIVLKHDQLESFRHLNQAHKNVLDLIEDQVKADSILYAEGGISEREFKESRKSFIDKQSILIENNLRQQSISGNIIDDEKEKFSLMQQHQSKVEELRLGIIKQISAIRQKFQDYMEEYIIRSPITGYASLPYSIVNEETVNEGDVVMFLSKTQNSESSRSEMYVGANNAGKIKAGMQVRVGLSEFDQKEFGIYYTTVKDVSRVQQDGTYKVTLECELPLTTSYNLALPARNSYSGDGEILIGKINLLTKISREIYFNKDKYASL